MSSEMINPSFSINRLHIHSLLHFFHIYCDIVSSRCFLNSVILSLIRAYCLNFTSVICFQESVFSL